VRREPVLRHPDLATGVSMTANHGSTPSVIFPSGDAGGHGHFLGYDNGQTGRSGDERRRAWLGRLHALVNQQAVANGRATIGSLNSTIYSIGQSAAYNQCFHDITTGNNFNTASPANYSAVTGYDLCTGWGTRRQQLDQRPGRAHRPPPVSPDSGSWP